MSNRCEDGLLRPGWGSDDEDVDNFRHIGDVLTTVLLQITEPPRRKVTVLSSADYADYLQTEHWQRMRRRVLSRCSGWCKRCYCDAPWLEVHHLTYDRLGCELESDLIAVCPQCHEELHGGEE